MNKTLKQWVTRIGAEDFPLFAHTARKIVSITQDGDHSTNELAEIILCDSALTARVLRMVNSAFYNPSQQQINTVSRAIVMLGFNVVRNISVSSSMIESMLYGERHDRALEELAISYHAAVQAKKLASINNEQLNEEEIFIAALLHRLGNIAFWCFPFGKAEKLLQEYEQRKSASEAELAVLGFKLSDLTRALIVEWKISSLLPDAMDKKNNFDASMLDIEFGYEIAQVASRGWQRDALGEIVHAIGNSLNIDEQSLEKHIKKTAAQASQSMLELGISNAGGIVASFEQANKGVNRFNKETEKEKGSGAKDSLLDLQFSVLRDLTYMISCQADINTILGAILEGSYRALAMDHVVLAIIDAKGEHIDARYVLGEKREELQKKFSFPVSSKLNDMINVTIKSQEAICLNKSDRKNHPEYNLNQINEVIGNSSLMLAPIKVKGSIKGVFFADKNVNEISEHVFHTFCHFCEHANIAFNAKIH